MEDGKIIQTKSTIRDVTSPIISEIRNRKTQHEKTEDGKNIQIKSSSEEKRANVAANPNVNVADLKDIRVRIDQVNENNNFDINKLINSDVISGPCSGQGRFQGGQARRHPVYRHYSGTSLLLCFRHPHFGCWSS